MDTQWFKSRKRELRVTDEDLAEAFGVSRSATNRIINGESAFKPHRADQVAELLRATKSEILFRAGIIDEQVAEFERHRDVVSSSNITVWGKVAAGVWLEESFVEPEIDHRPQVIYDQLDGDYSAEFMFAVEPEGDSMDLAFNPNTILICRRIPFGIGEVEAGRYVIVARQMHGLHEMTCKRLEIDENNDFLLCSESSNPKYAEPLRIKRSNEDEHVDEEITIIGVVEREVRDHSRRTKH